VLDIVALLTNQNDYTKTRNYWKYLKAKLKKENSQVVSITTQLKLLAPDSKKRLTDMLDYNREMFLKGIDYSYYYEENDY
jgi:cell filamentation protein